MQVETVGIIAFAVFDEEPAFRHALQIVFVEELARVAFFAETPKPVLADDGLFENPSR